jgi:hypothetical protein
MPDARGTRSRLCSKESTGVSNYRYAAINRHSLRHGFNGFLRALPGDRALLPPSFVDHPTNLAPASGRQNHTTSPSAHTPLVAQSIAPGDVRPSHPAPNVRDDREPPLLWVRDGVRKPLIWGQSKAKYFSRANWTTQIRLNQLEKLSFTRTSFSADQVVSRIVRHSESI